MPDADAPERDPVAAEKRALRVTAAARRATCAAGAGAGAGGRLADGFLASFAPAPDTIISGFWPMRGEIDVLPLLRRLDLAGRRTCLPVVPGPGRPLDFRAWMPGVPLVDGAYGARTPPADAAPLEPEWLLVPVLAFDRSGRRLGYGGGFYDRTLAALRATRSRVAVGVAYAGQEVAQVPSDVFDQRLDAVVTERGLIPLEA